jgi:histidinol-phosphate aminotransferase
MDVRHALSRRGFVGGVATALGYLGLKPARVWAQGPSGFVPQVAAQQQAMADYDRMIKLGNNENPWGPSDAVIKVMESVWKYSNRYGYPDANVSQVIADHHGVKRENLLLGAGSGEILRVMGLAYDLPGKKVVGVEPSYATVFQHASGLRADAIQLPLKADYTQDIDAMIEATKRNYRDVAFVYMCNPNNPTGVIVTKDEIRALLDGIPEDVPVLIDEAYHHFVEDPRYDTALEYVKEGRNVVVARTFSKIYGFAGLRLGYAVAPKHVIDRMSQYSTGSTNALVKWGVVAALSDPQEEQRVKRETIRIRNKTTTELKAPATR